MLRDGKPHDLQEEDGEEPDSKQAEPERPARGDADGASSRWSPTVGT